MRSDEYVRVHVRVPSAGAADRHCGGGSGDDDGANVQPYVDHHSTPARSLIPQSRRLAMKLEVLLLMSRNTSRARANRVVIYSPT